MAAGALSLSCAAASPSGGGARAPGPDDLPGLWRAVLASPGGELPFSLRIERLGDTSDGGPPPAFMINGEEAYPFSAVRRQGRHVVIEHEGFDARIEADLSGDGQTLTGHWQRQAGKTIARLPFSARHGDARRFAPPPPTALPDAAAAAAVPSVDGAWDVAFVDEDGGEPARAELKQEGRRVTGTMLVPSGDHRFLEGDYIGGLLRLSAFDGSHAFLYQARARADGTLAGDWWARDIFHATWTARRAGPQSALPDPYGITTLRRADGRLQFTFPDLDGKPVSLGDARFAGKVVIVNIFGSWCTNCNDEAPVLARWAERYGARGLEIVGLAYEMTGDVARDREMVRRFARRHGLAYPLLLAGLSGRGEASASLPDLSSVAAFPTTIFIGRDGKVAKIYSGYAGPGTGEHHRRMVERMEELIEELL